MLAVTQDDISYITNAESVDHDGSGVDFSSYCCAVLIEFHDITGIHEEDVLFRDAGYRAALTGAKGTVRLLIYVCVILVIILAAKTSYQFGHDVFAEEPVASRGKGKKVTVQVRSGMEAKELGELLKDNGLIDESLLVFEVQYRLSGYYGGIKDGSYVLNTAQTVDEMLEILAGVNTEGQPSAE